MLYHEPLEVQEELFENREILHNFVITRLFVYSLLFFSYFPAWHAICLIARLSFPSVVGHGERNQNRLA